ncbi:hypothetical protein ACRYCC_10535 [Actinomadura scrupuli]|uniref:hypothetical protein n=1 Tax=Actinomadura scrupuli TaxID=559629 RepID=UPI003D962ABB
MASTLGRPAKSADPSRHGPDALVGWLARTHRYNAPDADAATASTFAAKIASPGATRGIGAAMISRLENGTATWLPRHLAAYEQALGLAPGRLAGPAHKVLRAHGRHAEDSSRTLVDEQDAAEIVDCVLGCDLVTSAEWDLLSAHLVATGRRLGRRTWGLLVERLMLELCAAQGAAQDMRAEALLRIGRAQIASEITREVAVDAMTQRGNPASFQPLKLYQRTPGRAPASWVVRALFDPPDRWLLRELFSTVAALIDAGAWRPSERELGALRRECADTIGDAGIELEVRRAATQLMRRITPSAHLALRGGTGPELVYLAKPAGVVDVQSGRFHATCSRLAADIQDIGLIWQAKWDRGDDPLLRHILTQSLVCPDDAARSMYTALLVNSGYRDALRPPLAAILHCGADLMDPVLLRAVIRVFGKIAEGANDGWALLGIVDAERIDLDTRVQACWALANASPCMPSEVPDTMLKICRTRSFGSQAVTVLRAGVAACGRADRHESLVKLADDREQAPAVRAECHWWTTLPGYIRASART